MKDNKLFVFEKKEVVLIFIFIVMIAVISFTLGVRTGKSLSLKEDDYTDTDVKTIELKSEQEESVEKVVAPEQKENSFENSMGEESLKEDEALIDDQMESRLKEEMEKLANEKVEVTSQKVIKNNEQKDALTNKNDQVKEKPAEVEDQKLNSYVGKYTIQLFSHQSKESAQDFADGFIIKGHNIIINEVIIPGKGKWYRVGIGPFENINQAKDYLDKEKELFQNNKYIIRKI